MKTNTLFIPLGLLTLLGCAFVLAILITPLNFLLLQIILLGGIFLFYLLFKDITNVIIIWLLSLLFAMFFRTSIGAGIPHLSLDRLIWLSFIFYYLFRVIAGDISLSNRVTEALMFILVAIAVFSIVTMTFLSNKSKPFEIYSLLFNIYIVPFTVFIIAKDFIYDEQKIRRLFKFFSLILLYLSLTAIFEHFGLTAFVFPKETMNAELGINFGRARGPFLSASVNGTVIGMLSVTSLYMAMNTKMPYRIFFIINIFLSAVAVFFTYTRASWLGMIVAFIFVLSMSRKFRKYIGILILLGTVLMFPLHSKILNIEKVTSRINSKGPVYTRIALYHTYLAMIAEKPIMGCGFANFDNYSQKYFSSSGGRSIYKNRIVLPSIHDTFAGVLVELGALGFIVFLSILVSIFWKSALLFRYSRDRGFLGPEIVVTFWGVGAAYLVNTFFIDMKFHQFHNVIFYMIAGIILGLYQKRMRHAESHE